MDAGHLTLLQEKHKKILKLKNLSKKYLSSIASREWFEEEEAAAENVVVETQTAVETEIHVDTQFAETQPPAAEDGAEKEAEEEVEEEDEEEDEAEDEEEDKDVDDDLFEDDNQVIAADELMEELV